jgi:hypothetical protein
MVMGLVVLAGGREEGSSHLQHELTIPQWTTSENPVREKVSLPNSPFGGQELTACSVRLGTAYPASQL